jgi:predicted dehydrogenase
MRSHGSTVLRTAVVGAGKIAEQHLAAIEASPISTLVGICDANLTLARFMCRRFGGEPFGDLGHMLAAVDADVLHVLTPPHLHPDMAMQALRSGSHVMVEKPLALERSSREAVLAAAADSDRLLIEDHNYRFNRPMIRLQQDLAAGHLGRLVDVEVRIVMPMAEGSRYADRNLPSPSHRLPTGFIHEFITHLAYLTTTVLPGAEVLEARWSRRVPGHLSRYDELDATLRGGDAHGRLMFSSLGARSSIAVRVSGTQGSAEAEMIFGSYRIDRRRAIGDQLSPSVNALVDGITTAARGAGYVADRLRGRTAYEGLFELIRRFHEAAASGRVAPIEASEIRRAGDLVDDLVATMPQDVASVSRAERRDA